jgi:hypothetical protein
VQAAAACESRECRPNACWRFGRKSLRIDVPCDNSCDNSLPPRRMHGHSWSFNGRAPGPPDRQSRRSEAPDLRIPWWPGAGSNRRPSDFQAEFPSPRTLGWSCSCPRHLPTTPSSVHSRGGTDPETPACSPDPLIFGSSFALGKPPVKFVQLAAAAVAADHMSSRRARFRARARAVDPGGST